MKILEKAVYRGPHFFSHTPMVRIKVDIEVLEAWPSNQIDGFNNRLLELLPGLQNHGCSYKKPGGFVQRLRDGTWIGHVAEHVALELQTMAGMIVTRGKTRSVKTQAGVYNVMYAYEIERAGLLAGYYAFALINSLLPDDLKGLAGQEIFKAEESFTTLADAIAHLRQVARREGLGPTTKSIVDAAKKRRIPVARLDKNSLIQLGWGKNQRRIRASMTDRTSHIAVDAAGNKQLTKQLLKNVGVPVPAGDVVTSLDEAIALANKIGYPVAMKPLDGNHGRGVSTNLMNAEEVKLAFDAAQRHSRRIVVEKHFHGRDFRALIIDGKLVALAERSPAHVIGDGQHNIQQLVDIVNSDPRRGNGHEASLSKIIIDDQVRFILSKAGIGLDTVPQAGEKITLRGTANLSTGGTAIDRTMEVHPANVALLERAARTIGLDIAGIDIVAESISKPLGKTGGIIEVNAAPGFRMHLAPDEGEARPVGEAVISMLFPPGVPSRIPIVAVTGTNGKSTTCRMIAHILRCSGNTVGLTTTSGIYINDDLIAACDASGPQSARTILSDISVDYAVLETARGGILREGLGFDECNVGVVMNVSEDHIGLGGIHTVEDLASVKSIVTEAVAANGVSVLNADDPLTLKMARHAGGKICFFSSSYGKSPHPALQDHLAQGGMAVVCENWAGTEYAIVYKDKQRIPITAIDKIACTHNGVVGFNIQNALAAIAVAIAFDIDIRMIQSALATFSSSFEENPGRLNIIDAHGFRTIVDYAHNAAALTELVGVVDKMRGDLGALIAMVSVPGDRRDEDIKRMGRIAAEGFDRIVFRESPDRRGREPGEVNRLLTEGAVAAGFSVKDIIAVDTEQEAADICLSMAGPGDVVVLMPTDVPGIWERARAFSPKTSAATAEKAKVLNA